MRNVVYKQDTKSGAYFIWIAASEQQKMFSPELSSCAFFPISGQKATTARSDDPWQ